MSQEKLHKIDIRSKCLVYGYTRKIQREVLPKDIPFYIIPPSIIDICLLYFHIFEQWNIKNKPDEIKVEGDVATSLENYTWCTIHLDKKISKGIYVWKFRIVNRASNCLLIGILRSDKITDYGSYIGHKELCAYAFDGGYASICDYNKKNNWMTNYGEELKTGDIVEMHLDLVELSLSYVINDKSYGKSHDIVKGEYIAAISFFFAEDAVEILH